MEDSPANANIDRLFLFSLSIVYNSYTVQMSLGWLTQSALMPKKSKAIQIKDEGSMVALKAVMINQKEKSKEAAESGHQKRQMYQVRRHPQKNQGVEERNRRDEAAIATTTIKLREGAIQLQKKEKVYGHLESSKQNVDKLLVDFSSKKDQNEDEGQYQVEREQFYSGKLDDLQRQRDKIGAEGTQERDQRERLAWERQVLGELRGDVQEREKVQQVFDRRMRGEQKQALGEVLKQLGQQQKKNQEVKKRREEIQIQRLRKLKKLNIIGHACQRPTSQANQQQSQKQCLLKNSTN